MGNSITDKLIRSVSLRQLQIFEAVVRLGGYTRAAESLFLTQPTVSMQIKKLSESVGLQLLEHSGRKIHLTPAGLEAYAAARDIIDRMKSLAESAIEIDHIVKGNLNIAVITTATYFMPHLLGSFIEMHPQVKPSMLVTNQSSMLEHLKSNTLDLMIMGQPPQDLAVKAYPFIDNELVVAAAPNSPLAGKRKISLRQLCKQRLLVREPESGTRRAVDRLFAEHDLEIEPYMELGSSEAIKQAVMAGLGIAVLSRYNLRLELAGRHVAVLNVEHFPLKRRWYAAHMENKQLSLTARTFLDFILHESPTVLSHLK